MNPLTLTSESPLPFPSERERQQQPDQLPRGAPRASVRARPFLHLRRGRFVTARARAAHTRRREDDNHNRVSAEPHDDRVFCLTSDRRLLLLPLSSPALPLSRRGDAATHDSTSYRPRPTHMVRCLLCHSYNDLRPPPPHHVTSAAPFFKPSKARISAAAVGRCARSGSRPSSRVPRRREAEHRPPGS